jgi:hypothetical protein
MAVRERAPRLRAVADIPRDDFLGILDPASLIVVAIELGLGV